MHHAPAGRLAIALPFLSPTLTAALEHPKIIHSQVEVSAMCHVNLRLRGCVGVSHDIATACASGMKERLWYHTINTVGNSCCMENVSINTSEYQPKNRHPV